MTHTVTSHEKVLLFRPARILDIPRLRRIERDAGVPFFAWGMPEVAEAEPPSHAEFAAAIARDLCWIAECDGRLVAYLRGEILDGDFHISQVSVHPLWARNGFGRDLIEHAATLTRARGYRAMTLTTFRDIPWNARYYARLGFSALPLSALTPGLRRRHLEESGSGRWPRIAMGRSL